MLAEPMLKVYDRYVLLLFAKVLVICFVSLTGLYIVIDAFGNLDEFISYGNRQGSLVAVLTEYYGARVLSFFDKISGLLSLIAVIFVVTWLQRSNEITAVMAGGVSQGRVIRPLIAAVMVISLLAAANRELGLPQVREKLVRNAQDWMGESAQKVTPQHDYRSNILISGVHCYSIDRRIEQPAFMLHEPPTGFGRKIVAEVGFQREANVDHPAGYLLKDVSAPASINELPSARLQPVDASGAPVNPVAVSTAASNPGPVMIYCPADTPWLEEGECFVVSDVGFQQLSGSGAWRQYASTKELVAGMHNPSLDFGADIRVMLHARMVQPLLDVTLLLLGLPLVISRENRNLFVAAGYCLLLVAIFFIVLMTCHALGGSGLLSPALAAWSPLMIFAPIAFTMSAPLRE